MNSSEILRKINTTYEPNKATRGTHLQRIQHLNITQALLGYPSVDVTDLFSHSNYTGPITGLLFQISEPLFNVATV